MQEVLAREAIRELVLRYCRAIDRRDFELRLDAEETADELMRGTNVGGFREADPSHGFFRLI